MLRCRSTRTLTVWMACLALLMSAFAPTLSRAFGAQAPDWTQICSTASAESSSVPTPTGQPDPVAPVFEHCPCCSLHGHLAGLPPAPPDTCPLLPLSFEAPALFFSAPRTLHAWATAQPRAPPVLS